MINFTGKYISSGTIYKRSNSGKYKNTRAAIVELSPKSNKDLKFLEKTADSWQSCFGFEILASRIYHNALQELKDDTKMPAQDVYQTKFYTITAQRGHFDKLKPERALALAEVSLITDDLLELDLCQVEPSCVYGKENRKYTQIGTALINFLIDEYKKYTIVLSSLEPVKGFYRALGFESISNDNSRWMYKRD